VLVVGAGPAGLAATLDLSKRGERAVCLEADRVVGGLSRTVSHQGFRFDIGGHRFFTRYAVVRDLWAETLGDDLLRRPRLSRIFYRGRFFHYPIRPLDALAGLGLRASALAGLSYLEARARPVRPERTFEDWVANRFGRRLFEHFFQTYTEKVWGIPCHELQAEWAAQRIQGLSLASAVLGALRRRGPSRVKSLIDEFDYPRLGPGQMYEAMAQRVERLGNEVRLGHRVRRIEHDGRRVRRVVAETGSGAWSARPAHLVSSMPVTSLVRSLHPAAPDDVLAAAESLRYRALLTVNLLLARPETLPDTWIYVHDPAVRVARVQLPHNWSPDLVPSATQCSRGLEYFCDEGDRLWRTADASLVTRGVGELQALGLCGAEDVFDGFVVRTPRCYPVYDSQYRRHLARIRSYLDRFDNLHPVGRAGLFKYNNADHSILTALLAVENILGARHDVWAVNADDQYHEASD